MPKMAVIGYPDTILCFRAYGLDVYPAECEEEARNLLKMLTAADRDYAILFLDESLAASSLSEISKYASRPSAAVILIPGRRGTLGIGQSAIRAAVERATGTSGLL